MVPLTLGGLLLGLCSWSFSSYPLERLENVTYDWRFRLRGSRKPSDEVLVIYVDDESLTKLKIAGGSPSRAQFARVVDECLDKGATVVGLDYVLAGETPSDAALEQVMGEETSAVVLACNIARGETGWQMPDERFQRVALGVGFINYWADSDGSVRRARYRAQRLVPDGKGGMVRTWVNSFPLELLCVHLDLTTQEIEDSYEKSGQAWELDLPDLNDRTKKRRVRWPFPNGLVNFIGARGSFETVSFWKVHQGQLAGDLYKGRAVLIGDATTTRSGYDFIHTPFTTHRTRIVDGQPVVAEDAIPGVEYHASTLQTMLEGSFIEQSKGRWMQPVLLLLSVLFGWLICWKKMPIRLVVLLPALLSVLLVSSAWLLFDRWRIRIDVVLPLLGVGLQFGGALGLVLYRLRKSRQEISGLFGRYVSQNYVNLLIQKVSEGQGIDGLVAGDRREISVLFSDVRGFTSLSEATDPATVAQILRVYFTGMIRILREEYQATMDKLLGDGLMAFYNAPLPQQDHAARAVRSALAMLQAVAELDLDEILDVDQIGDLGSVGGQERYQLKIGIGINSGLAIIGDLGSETFADYTVLGDSVNLAARLEALNKIYGTSILISEYTYEAVKTEFTCRRVDHVRVKGRVEPVWIYEVMSLASQVTPGQQALCAAYEGALSARDSGDAQLAESELQRLVLRHPDDGPTAYMLSQIRAVQSDSTSS